MISLSFTSIQLLCYYTYLLYESDQKIILKRDQDFEIKSPAF